MILCDTNILIEFYKANPVVIQTLQLSKIRQNCPLKINDVKITSNPQK